MPTETVAAQNERMATFTCRMEQNERGSVRAFLLAQSAQFDLRTEDNKLTQSVEWFVLQTLAKKSTHAKSAS